VRIWRSAKGEPAHRPDDHPDGGLGDGVVVRPRRRRDEHAAGRRRVQVDRVVADPGPGDDLEERRRLDHAPRPRLHAGDGGGALPDRLGQHVLVASLGRRQQHQLVAIVDQRP
jgi:hypothetical protein